MSELDKLIENYFAPRSKTITKQILYELFDEALKEVQLSPAHLVKRNNVDAFIEKIINKEPFLAGDEKMFLTGEFISKAGSGNVRTFENFKDLLYKPNLSLKFEADDGKYYSLSKFLKTKEFGRRDCTQKEIIAMNELDNEVKEAIKKSGTDAITIELVDFSTGEIVETVDDVIGVEQSQKVDGVDPKSDFELVRKDGKPRIFISHKWGKEPKHFGQWSGATSKAGAAINEHPEVQKFIEDLIATQYITPLQPPRSEKGRTLEYEYQQGVSVGRKVVDPKLKMLAVFGNGYDPATPGNVENVDVVVQGNIILQKCADDSFALTAHHMMLRKSAGFEWDEGYEPALISRFATARTNFNIAGLRMTIYPTAGRKVTEWI